MSLASADVRRLLRHAAVLHRYDLARKAGDPTRLHTEWAEDFSVQVRALTLVQLGELVERHRLAMRAIVVRGYGDQVAEARDLLDLVRMALGR